MRVTLQVWETVRAKVEKSSSWWRVVYFRFIPDPVIWARYGIGVLADIVCSYRLRTFDLKRERRLPNYMFFRYIQLSGTIPPLYYVGG